MIDSAKSTSQELKIGVPSLSRITFLYVNDIVRCMSEESYTHLFLVNGTSILSTKPLKEYDQLLSTQGFYRIHRSHLINLRMVAEYVKNERDSVVLEDGTCLSLSRKKRVGFLEAMNRLFLLNTE